MKKLVVALIMALGLNAFADYNGETPAQALRDALLKYGPAGITSPTYKPGLIRHIVMFRFDPMVSDAQKAEVRARFLDLQRTCVRNGRPYILSIETGVQSSGEGLDQEFEQVYTVTFKSEGDRNYYVGQPIISNPNFYDPAHQAFKNFVGPLLHRPINPSGVLVFDYAVEAKKVRTGLAKPISN